LIVGVPPKSTTQGGVPQGPCVPFVKLASVAGSGRAKQRFHRPLGETRGGGIRARRRSVMHEPFGERFDADDEADAHENRDLASIIVKPDSLNRDLLDRDLLDRDYWTLMRPLA